METARPSKIDQKILHHLLVSEGYSQRQAADYFGVSGAAISKCVKKLNINLTRHVGMERAKEVANYGLDVVRQLNDINRTIRQELEWATREARREEGDRKGLQRVIVELSGEVRKQLGFQLEVLRSLYDFKAAEEFQQEVLNAIGAVSPETRQAIIERLTQGRALRSAFTVSLG